MLDYSLDNVSIYNIFNITAIAFGFIFWVLMIFISTLSWYLSTHKYKPASVLNKRKPLSIPGSPFVSIIRPLSGLDFMLYQNLETSFTQDYTNFEIIFSVHSPNDPSIPVVKKLMSKYPNVDAKIIIDECTYGVNPKVNNMVEAYKQAKYDLLWICDSNVYLNKGTLGRALVELIKPEVGLVHHLPIGLQAQSFGAMLDAIFLNTTHAKLYSAVNFLKLDSCVMGKSCLYRKSDFERFGGMEAATKVLAEDHWIAKNIWDLGLKHVMVEDLIYQPMGEMPLSSFFGRRSRWLRLRKYISMLSILLEPFTECVLNGLIASYSFSSIFSIHPLNFFAFHVVTWFALDLITFQSLIGKPVSDFRKYMVAWGFREVSALPLFLYSILGNSLNWRGKDYILTTGTMVISCDSIAPSPYSIDKYLQDILQHPIAQSTVSFVVTSIHLLADILHKSQRNGIEENHESDPLLGDTKDIYSFLAPNSHFFYEDGNNIKSAITSDSA